MRLKTSTTSGLRDRPGRQMSGMRRENFSTIKLSSSTKISMTLRREIVIKRAS